MNTKITGSNQKINNKSIQSSKTMNNLYIRKFYLRRHNLLSKSMSHVNNQVKLSWWTCRQFRLPWSTNFNSLQQKNRNNWPNFSNCSNKAKSQQPSTNKKNKTLNMTSRHNPTRYYQSRRTYGKVTMRLKAF